MNPDTNTSAALVALPDSIIEKLALNGDVSGLKPAEKVAYYRALCARVGLDPSTQPFKLLRLSGREVFYCDRGGAAQLNRVHGVSHTILSREVQNDCYVVTARASANGRHLDSLGAVPIGGLKGEALCNAMMKGETKAKRRATLDLLGLGMLDETEVGTIPGALPTALPEPEPEEIISEWAASTPATPSPAPEKPLTSQPQAIKRATNLTVHWALEQLKALDGEPNRPTIKAFLIAAGAIREDQEPENWRLNLVPVTPGQLRELGVAIANFDRGDKAVIPYAPKQSAWGEYVVPFGKFKDHKLGTVPEDVQKWFFHNFKLSDTWESHEKDGTVKTHQKTEANKLKDRDFREALDAMGAEKHFTKEETTP